MKKNVIPAQAGIKMIPTFAGMTLIATPTFACTVCFGDKTSNMVRSLWPGMYLLIGLTALVFVPILYLGFTWMRREREQSPS